MITPERRALQGAVNDAARDERVRASYDAVATTYADHLVDELLDGLPFETWLLDRVATHAGAGPVGTGT